MHTYTNISIHKCLTYTLSRSLLQTEQFAVLWILFTIIVLGNSAVLFVMFINKNRKSRMNYFIKQLALAGECRVRCFNFSQECSNLCLSFNTKISLWDF